MNTTTEFQSPLHRTMWNIRANLFDLERTTAWITDEALAESCRQLYHYVTDAYDDILENPQDYGLVPDGDSTDFATDKQLGEKVKFHLNILYNPLRRRYGSFLDLAVDRKRDCLVLRTLDYDNLLKNIKNKKYNSVKVFTQDGVFEKLLGTLSRRGFIIERHETETIIRNQKYPQMFLAADLLFQADLKYYNRAKRTPQFFNLLDFREIQETKRKWDVEDIIGGLYDDQKKNVYSFIDYVSQKIKFGKSCKIWYYRTAEFTYKGRELWLMRWGKSYNFDISLPVIPPDSDEYLIFEDEISKLPNNQEIREFYYTHILTCNGCSAECVKKNAYKKNWSFFGNPLGKLIRSCEQRVMVYDFLDENYMYFKTLIDIYITVFNKSGVKTSRAMKS